MSLKTKISFVIMFSAYLQASTVLADQVIADDLVVTHTADFTAGGSMCIGLECVDGEEFGYDTLRLKGDDPQIGFVDTSSSASFPTNDWAMGITDNAVNGPARFFIKDISNASTALLLEAGVTGGVAIGSNSTLVENAISFGSAGAERRITNVADGVAGSDAVNVSQFSAFQAQIQIPQATTDQITVLDDTLSQANSRIDALNARVQELIDRVNQL